MGDTETEVGRWVVLSAVTGTVLIGLGAFWLSFTALADLAHRAGTAAQLSWVWPLIVDGVIVVATISVVALSRHGARATRYPWLLLAGGAAVSVSANVTHALVAADTTVPPLLAALVASVPPVVLLAITHLTVVLTRYQGTVGTEDHAATSTSATSAPDEAQAVQKLEALRAQPGVPARPTRRQIDPATPVALRQGAGGEREAAARQLRGEGMSNRQIAAQLAVHPSTVGRWLTPRTGTALNNAPAPGKGQSTARAGDNEGEHDVHHQ
ncbi:DUF2637 domain-containing protein [Microbacterium tumbae]